jgi:hypothetical protein
MKGTDLTPAQIQRAEEFVMQRAGQKLPIDHGRLISIPFGQFVRVIAWYGALRYQAGAAGINSLDDPGELEVRR